MNKTVIVSEYFYPHNSSTAHYLTEIAKTISVSTEGRIEIVCNSDLDNQPEIDFAEGKITRIKEDTFDKNSLFQRIIKFLIATFRLSFRAFRSLRSGDRLFTVTNPAFLLVSFALFKKMKKFHYTLLVYDVFPENIIATGLLKEQSLLYKMTKKIFDWAYSQADLLIVIGRDMQQLITAKTEGKIPTVLIPNWCDVETVIPADKQDNPIIRRLGLENKIVFAFTGNFGRVQGIEMLLNAASMVENDDFVLLFIGDGALRPAIEKYITDDPHGKVMYAGSYPSDEQNTFLNACDVAVVSLNEGMYGLGVPSKSYYNMAAGKPLLYIGHPESEIAQVIQTFHNGWISISNHPQSLALTIDDICTQKKDFHLLGKRSRIAAESFSHNVIAEKYANLFRTL